MFRFSMCYRSWFKKDPFLCLALRHQMDEPITLNITRLRNLLINMNSKKIKYEIWEHTRLPIEIHWRLQKYVYNWGIIALSGIKN